MKQSTKENLLVLGYIAGAVLAISEVIILMAVNMGV